ncbi:MAG: cytochrome c [Proteobacteria bacterium]|nr:cytochrome c [Pseudomonadota bacterium]
MKTQYKCKPALAAFKLVIGLFSALLLSHQALALATLLGDAENGAKVLEDRCTACHVNMFGGDGSAIYTRDDHSVKTIEGLMQRVEVCNTNTQNGELNADQLDDITSYLNETHYKYEDE